MTLLWRGWLALLALALGYAGYGIAGAVLRPLPARSVLAAQPVPTDLTPHSRAVVVTRPATAGATGTAELPPLPIPAAMAAAIAAAEPGVVAARPFSLAGASATDRARALQCLADAVYYEAASEPDAGQRAVAQVVLNRVRHPAFPATVCGVVYQGARSPGCQFSFACDGALARIPSRAGWARAARVAAAALAGYVFAPAGLATHYHTYAVTPAWNQALVMTDAEGAHLFHRWKGWWGTSAAFRQVYAGHEPAPAPPLLLAPTPVTVPAIAAAPVTAMPLGTIRPAHRETSVLVAPPPTEDHLPPAAAVLPRWRDSGQPL